MRTLRTIVFYSVLVFNFASSYVVDPGPTIIATKGAVWPIPQEQKSTINYYVLNPEVFQFQVVAETCELLQDALERYMDIILNSTVPKSRNESFENVSADKNYIGNLDSLNISLSAPCRNWELPTFEMKEEYTLDISQDGQNNILSSLSIWGILRGLETFSQLLYPSNGKTLQINCTTIHDFPRFPHRGLLIDTSRHFIPISHILKILDAMSYNKLNVFHWHITDDQSFPYESKKYPELSKKGAYLATQTYSVSDIKKTIKYAGARAIRVMVEFDTPGHTRSWGEAIPDLLTPCYEDNLPSGQYGPVDPTKNFTYTFMEDFFSEVVRLFPEQYLHLGGDEVEFECWRSNPDIDKFMKENNITSYQKLEGYYIQKLLKIANNLNVTSVVWEEVFSNNVQLSDDVIVHIWKLGWMSTMNLVTRKGYKALLSSCWYLDHLETGGDWKKFYNCEPYSFSTDENRRKKVLGGEACMWSEVVNMYNLESRIWPRASAAAEKLWSAYNADSIKFVAKRLEEHTCRMNKRNIAAQPPSGAGFCEL